MSRIKVSDEAIVAAYERRLSAYKAAEDLGINWKTVYDALARSGVAARGLQHYRAQAQKYPTEVQAQIREMYESGISTPELRRQFGGSQSSVVQAIKRAGGKIRPPQGRPAKFTEEEARDICERYRSGMSTVALAVVTHHSQPSICALLKRSGVPLRRGRKNKVRYRYEHSNGYVYVRVQPDDPMIVMCMSKGLVPEHRLVMARKLGRPLLSSETVHHIDGDRGNNADDNLQLRQGKHGKHVVMVCLDCGSHRIGPAKIKD